MRPDTGDSRAFDQNVPRPSPRLQGFELAVFLFLILPSLILSLFVVGQGPVGFATVALSTIFRDLGLVFLILYFLWRNGEPLQMVGWTTAHIWQEIVLGLVLFIPFYIAVGLIEIALRSIGLSAPPSPPTFLTYHGTAELVLAIVLVSVVAVAEETIFRGYIGLRFYGLTASRVVVVVLTALIFSVGHGYEGSAGVATVGIIGALFAIIYIWRRSLVAPMVMHFLLDFIGIVLAPLLTGLTG